MRAIMRSREETNERALAMYKQIYGERHPRVADILINLGAIQLDTGHYRERNNMTARLWTSCKPGTAKIIPRRRPI